jgi:hypothetical protein
MKMKTIYSCIILLFSLFSCSEEEPSEIIIDNEKVENTKNQTLEEMVNNHVERQLSIPRNEKYSLKIYKEHLDGDDKIDAIITVNRLEFALEDAKKSEFFAQRKALDFTGHFNYIFYFDGGLNQISPEIIISSSPQAELEVKFENVTTEAYKDVIVDYNIQNSQFRNFYTVINHTPRKVFQWKIYDYLTESKEEANYLEYGPGTVGLAKDILIYEGKLENSKNVTDIYNFTPKISKKEKLLYRFFYFDSEGKYFTKK